MIAGLTLKETVNEKSQLAFLEDKLECIEASTNPDIVEEIEERKPELVAVDAGTEEGRGEFTQKEQDLKEEGHAFTPTSHESKRTRRLEALKAQLFEEMGAESPEIIRFDPHITAKELAIHDDQGLESLGVETSNIKSAQQFDAALGAITARFYQQNQYENLGVIVPESMDDEE